MALQHDAVWQRPEFDHNSSLSTASGLAAPCNQGSTREVAPGTARSGPCQHPPRYNNEGDQAAMSQGDSAPRAISRHSSRSPTEAGKPASSPPLRQTHDQQDGPRATPHRDPVSFGLAQSETINQQGANRVVDTRGVFNPASSYGDSPAGQQHSSSRPQPSSTGGGSQSSMAMGQYGADRSPSHHFVYQASGSSTPRSTSHVAPPTTSPAVPSTSASADRGSPQSMHPYPVAARRILTPKSPRTASLSRAAMRTVESQHFVGSLPPPVPRGPHETQIHGNVPSPLGSSPHLRNSAPDHGPTDPPTTRPTSGLSRSLSHPNLSHGVSPAPPNELLQTAGHKREHSGRPVLSGPPFAAPLPPSHSFSTPAAPEDSRWGSNLLGSMSSGAARNLPMVEGQPFLAITPRHGEEIVVAVDVHQGSRQADQKRQRNAGASARFRQRKKEREREQQEEFQKLENENRDLERKNEALVKHCQDLEADRDFYRESRNRLRDIISRMPNGQEWIDREPASPMLRTAEGPSASESSTLLHQPPPVPSHGHSPRQHHHQPPFYSPHLHPLSQPHPPRLGAYGDSSLEPPARRRRTDSEPQLPTSSYNLMTPTSLLPITGPGPGSVSLPPHASFAIPPSPHVTPPLGAARLPPLRFDQSRTPSTTPPPIRTAPPPQLSIPPPHSGDNPYVSTRRLPYETGWATDPRPEGDGSGPR
ncbi:hypothetical protein B0J18DRAFT_450057 [Chaetomium sp. MPI-SDFR-AT-0129]|nr:hypothetical protein B0J18DRAFT_450057 [Chaetomium sp. MPI-SDFR-AT-0129]